MSRTGYRTDMRVYEALQGMARRGCLPLERLAAEAGISRGTARESIKRLVARGMVEAIPVPAGAEPWSADLSESGRPRARIPSLRGEDEFADADAAVLKALAERPEGDLRANASALAREVGMTRHAVVHALDRLAKKGRIRVWREGAAPSTNKVYAQVLRP